MADAAVSSTATTPERPQRGNRGHYRGRGRGRGNGRGGGHRQENTQNQNHPPAPLNSSGRVFGGQLTRDDSQLDASAVAFIPASIAPVSSSSNRQQNSKPKPQANSNPQPRRQRRPSRSSAPDIATRIHEDIAHNIYECAICTNEISRHSKVWSCHTCWTVFHIGCVKKWSKNEGSAVQQRNPHQDNSDLPVVKQWRCPGCNLAKDDLPSAYNCWCEKEMEPRVMTGLPPHSCGQTCGRDRTFPRTCPHPCDEICHAGPCPPCTSMGPKQSCFCGKNSSTRRCVDTEYESGWSCGQVCGDMMPCGEHTCPRPCHEGLCGACEVEVDAKCYCGKAEQTMMCSEQEEEKESHGWTGVFDCHQACGRKMDCGIHECEKNCHPQDEAVPHCPRSPDVVKNCPCGKTALSDLGSKPREACTDPIPSCSKACERQLPCGHLCSKSCHTGYCPPCFEKVPLTCRCSRTKFETTCYGVTTEQPQCFRTCKASLNCGRHECGEKCCPGERKAAERQATKRKLKSLSITARAIDEGIEVEHICTRVCGRPLKCGNHTCADLCHKGPCGTCREAIFNDISCNCGRTTLQAPLPCGTRPPPCNFPCRRPKDCGHPPVVHNCHTDEEECPKCPFLTEKSCLCSKKVLKNQPCWRADVLCGLVCGRLLKCGSHTCRKTCHKPGECEDAQTHCQQECCKPKKTCGHPCEQPCHAPSACKEEKACPFKVMITCDCQRKKEEVRCNARAHTPVPSGRQTSLKCDDECARLARNRILKAALQVSDDHVDDHVPYSTETLQRYLEDVPWAHKQEEILRIFAADDTEKRLRFAPMKRRQRSFIHHLAEDFGFDCESLDPEPHRHVVLFKTPSFVSAPMKSLAQAARIRRAQLNIQAPIQASPQVEKRADEASKHDHNGYLLRNPRFALTEDELSSILATTIPSATFNIRFLSNTDAVALILKDGPEETKQKSSFLSASLSNLSIAISQSKLAGTTVLCTFDLSTHPEPLVLHTADLSSTLGPNVDGWSQVAQRRPGTTTPRAPVTEAVGQKTMYTVLGSRLAEAKRKKAEEEQMRRRRAELEKEEIVEDWSMDVEDEEKKEKANDADKDTGVEARAEVEAEEDQGPGSGAQTSVMGSGTQTPVPIKVEQ